MPPTETTTSLPAARPTTYNPGPLRRAADAARNAVDRFVAKYPEYGRLAPDVLQQYAATYRDDKDHALEQDFRDNMVLSGCRADYGLWRRLDHGDYLTSDVAFSMTDGDDHG